MNELSAKNPPSETQMECLYFVSQSLFEIIICCKELLHHRHQVSPPPAPTAVLYAPVPYCSTQLSRALHSRELQPLSKSERDESKRAGLWKAGEPSSRCPGHKYERIALGLGVLDLGAALVAKERTSKMIRRASFLQEGNRSPRRESSVRFLVGARMVVKSEQELHLQSVVVDAVGASLSNGTIKRATSANTGSSSARWRKGGFALFHTIIHC